MSPAAPGLATWRLAFACGSAPAWALSSGCGLAAAGAWGAADFSGGVAAKRAPPALVVLLAHTSSLALLILVNSMMGASLQPDLLRHVLPWSPGSHALYGLISGLFCGGGLMLLYWSLSLGAMGISAAISGVLTAAVPVVFSLLRYGHPSALTLAGFAVAAAALWLVTYTPEPKPQRLGPGLKLASALAVGAGLSFGAMLIFMHRAAADGVLTALTWMRVASAAVALTGCAIVWLRRLAIRSNTSESAGASSSLQTASTPDRFRWPAIPRLLWIAGIAGVLDLAGNFLYLVASRTGRLDVSAVLAAFYPAVTIALAVWLLRERASRSQWAGMGLALLAVLLITF